MRKKDPNSLNKREKAILKFIENNNYEIVDKWNNISPALVLYFDNNKPMPIREYRFDEYFKLINI